MGRDVYDIAIEGTTLKDIEQYESSGRVVVIDMSGNYGTTYRGIESLRGSPYINDLEVTKNTESVGGTRLRVSVESLPFLLSYGDRVVESFKARVTGEMIEYVDIKDIFYISEDITRIPTSKNDILEIDVSDDDRFYMHKALMSADMSVLERNFGCKSHPVYQALAVCKVFGQRDLERVSRNFGSGIFVYPVYGISEISESVSMLNSFSGTTYVLNTTLRLVNAPPTDEYYIFTCDLGTLYAKKFKQQQLDKKEHFIRVVITYKQKFHGNFLAFLAPEDLSGPCEGRFTKVIGLNSSAEVCNEGLQLLYFIRRCEKVTDREVQRLQIFEKDILVDLSFRAIYDIDQFS